MKMSEETYDLLKWIAQILLPALATFCVAIAGIWKLPYGEIISGTIMAVDAFLGKLLEVSSKQYYKELDVAETDE